MFVDQVIKFFLRDILNPMLMFIKFCYVTSTLTGQVFLDWNPKHHV